MALIGNNNEEKIWNYLFAKLNNPYGVAGIMGNIQAESGCVPTNLQNTFEKKLGMTDAEYTKAVDNGSYTNFIKDSAGYGLVQWTYWSLKQDLYNYVKSKKASIGDLEIQLEFLCKQLSESYSVVWNTCKNAKTVLEASNAMLFKFERPADQSEAVQQKRASYGQEFLNKFKTTKQEGGTTNMSVTICHASISENGNAGWDGRAAAGDQTGREVCTRSWYNKPWDIMLRYPDANIAKKAATAAKKLANSNLVGYDQSQRNTLYQQLKKNNFDVDAYIRSGVKTETDCSAFVYACYACYIPKMRSDSNAPVTSTMRSQYQKWGFTLYTASKYISQDSYLQIGDILDKESVHTAMAITNGSNAGSTTSVTPPPTTGNTAYVGKGIGTAVAKTYMNIRPNASTAKAAYGTIATGTKVEVLEVLSNGWYKIVWPGCAAGYAYTSNTTGTYFSYTANPKPAPTPSGKVTAKDGAAKKDSSLAGTYKTTANLNLRDGAGTSKKILVTIPKGTTVKNYGYYTAVSGTKWLYVQFTYKNVLYTGFASGKYLQKQ